MLVVLFNLHINMTKVNILIKLHKMPVYRLPTYDFNAVYQESTAFLYVTVLFLNIALICGCKLVVANIWLPSDIMKIQLHEKAK